MLSGETTATVWRNKRTRFDAKLDFGEKSHSIIGLQTRRIKMAPEIITGQRQYNGEQAIDLDGL